VTPEKDSMDEEKSTPNPSAVGGAAGEAGSDFRAAVGAWIVVHALAGKKLEGVGPSAMRPVPTGLVLAESDSPVDDLEVKLQGGLVLYIQAKRSLRISKDPESEFGKAVAQCCALAGRDGFMTEKARMAIVVGESTQPLRALAKALERRRAPIAGKASTGERKALAVLSGHLQELEESTRASLLSALDVLILDMGSPNSAPRERGEAWLDGRVVPHGKASLAWDVIESKIKKLAKHRLGAGVSQWMSWLEQAGIEVLHSRHTPAGQAMELARANSRYFAHLERAAAWIALDYLLPGVPPLPVSDTASHPSVAIRGTDTKQPLSWAQRRRGRVLLTGPPGMGKSTALRRLAGRHFVAEDTPFPLLVSVPRLLDADSLPNPLEAIVQVALQQAPESDRQLLAEHVKSSLLHQGRAILLLDSLDECRGRAPETVSRIRAALAQCHPDVEVVLATRDSAFASARTLLDTPELGFSPEVLSLEPPAEGEFAPLLSQAARAMTAAAGVEDLDAEVDARLAWLELHRQRDALGTPLAAWTLLALSGTRLDAGSLPRAQLLSRLVEELATRWEWRVRRRGALRLIRDLLDQEALGALLVAFDHIGDSLIESEPIPETRLRDSLTKLFQRELCMGKFPADAAAVEALHFWDEAGIFVAEGGQHLVRSRIRLFSELATARVVADKELEDQRVWVQQALQRPHARETLLLLTGLSPPAASHLAVCAIASTSREEMMIAAHAIKDGAAVVGPQLEELVKALLSVIRAATREDWEIVEAVLELPLETQLHDLVEEVVRQRFPPERGALVAAMRWFRVHPSQPLEPAILLPLLDGAAARRPPRASRTAALAAGQKVGLALEDMGVDSLFQQVVESAADAIRPGRPGVARTILGLNKYNSHGSAEVVRQRLRRRGYAEEVAQVEADLYPLDKAAEMMASHALTHAAQVAVFRSIAAEGDHSADWASRRRMADLVGFAQALLGGEVPAAAVDVVVVHRRDLAERAAQLVLRLGGFDAERLRAQISALDWERDFLWLLLDPAGPEDRDQSSWPDPPDDESIVDEVFDLLRPNPWLAYIAIRALRGHPDPGSYLPRLEARVAPLSYCADRRAAARHLLVAGGDLTARVRAWADSDDSFLVKLAARGLRHLAGQDWEFFSADIAELLRHPDGAIRAALLMDPMDKPAPLAGMLDCAAVPGPDYWSCHGCGQKELAATLKCRDCKAARPTCPPWFPSEMGLHIPPP